MLDTIPNPTAEREIPEMSIEDRAQAAARSYVRQHDYPMLDEEHFEFLLESKFGNAARSAVQELTTVILNFANTIDP